MRLRFLFIAVLLVASLSGAVAAQETPNETAENTTAEDECNQAITEHIRLCSSDYVDGEAVVVLDSDRRERVTVTEAVALTEHREINRESFIVDGRTEIRLGVEATNGKAGVTVDDGNILYGIPIRTETVLIGGPFTASDAQAAAIGGGLGTAIVALYLVLKVLYGRNQKPERLA